MFHLPGSITYAIPAIFHQYVDVTSTDNCIIESALNTTPNSSKQQVLIEIILNTAATIRVTIIRIAHFTRQFSMLAGESAGEHVRCNIEGETCASSR